MPFEPPLSPEEVRDASRMATEGEATRVVGVGHASQTSLFLAPRFQAILEGTGTDPCPLHSLDHGVRDPSCDYCNRALGRLYRHRLKGDRNSPIFAFDFSGPHPQRPPCLWGGGGGSLSDMKLLRAFGLENRQSDTVLPCLHSGFDGLRALIGTSRLQILRSRSEKARDLSSPMFRAYLHKQGVRQTMTSGHDHTENGLVERLVRLLKVRGTAVLADLRLPPKYWS